MPTQYDTPLDELTDEEKQRLLKLRFVHPNLRGKSTPIDPETAARLQAQVDRENLRSGVTAMRAKQAARDARLAAVQESGGFPPEMQSKLDNVDAAIASIAKEREGLPFAGSRAEVIRNLNNEKDAEAQMVAAKASAESIKFITEAVKENNASAMFLLGDRYITALQKMSSSENSKVIVMPGDLVGAVKSLIGGK